MAQVTGILKLYIDGKMMRTKPGAKFKVGGKKREAVSGHSVYGFAEEVVHSELDCTIAHMSDTDAVAISGYIEQTLKVETDTGQTYIVKNAWVSEPCELSSGGDMSLKMMGEPAIKQ